MLIFFGEVYTIRKSGASFINTRTGEPIEYTLQMHFRYFFINQEKWFGLIVIVCIVMAVVLLGFFFYHLMLAWGNQTTNESMKRKSLKSQIDRELSIIRALQKETIDWEPKSKEKKDALMPNISIDGIELPRQKIQRQSKLKEMIKHSERKMQRLTDKTPYQPYSNPCKALYVIWHQK